MGALCIFSGLWHIRLSLPKPSFGTYTVACCFIRPLVLSFWLAFGAPWAVVLYVA